LLIATVSLSVVVFVSLNDIRGNVIGSYYQT